jgi:hypothetical protein
MSDIQVVPTTESAYKILFSFTIAGLEERVNSFLLLNPGWEAIGGMGYADNKCTQAITRAKRDGHGNP